MIEVLKQMVEALEYHVEQTRPISKTKEAIQAGKQAIAELESQEPVACPACNGMGMIDGVGDVCKQCNGEGDTHPPQRTEQEPTDIDCPNCDSYKLCSRKQCNID